MNGTPTILGVLIVDDHAVWSRQVIDRIEKRLPESNRKVRWEASVTAGLKALEEFHADNVILDLDLPDSRPFETIPKIKEFGAHVYVMSDHFDKKNPTGDAIAMECMKAGARRVYTKDAETVEWMIGELVQSHVRMTLNGSRA